jgi:aspartyl-tRNA(Asn)/glutamyl-tRNA(Gln) amidotransferase subunit A
LLKAKKISSVELTKEYLARIKAVDAKVRAIVTVTEDFALQQAKKADETIAAGKVRAADRRAFLAQGQHVYQRH